MKLPALLKSILPGSTTGQPRPSATYFSRSMFNPLLASWQPALREPRDDVRAAYRLATARAIDGIQNSGFLSGIVEQNTTDVIGNGLILSAKPDFRALGWTENAANEFATLLEGRFYTWANNPYECDARAKFKFGQTAAAQYRMALAAGEHLSLVVTVKDNLPGSQFNTKVMTLPPWRITDNTLRPKLSQGVYVNKLGAATAYQILAESDFAGMAVNIPVRDQDGRLQVIHVYDGDPSQTRGISLFAPALKIVRQFDQLSDATLTTALLQTIFAATIRSQMKGEAAFEGLKVKVPTPDGKERELTGYEAWMYQKMRWYEDTKIDLTQHGRIAHLYPDEELQFHSSNHPNENYDTFSAGLWREIARCVGMTYEAATGDHRGATYSSERMGIATIWPVVTTRRERYVAPFYQAAYEAVIEEDVFKGRIPFPGGHEAFLHYRSAVCNAVWRGPAAPQADDLKTAKAQDVRLKNGSTSLERICSENGEDWQDVADQRKRETDYYASRGMPDPHAVPQAANQNDGIEALLKEEDQPAEAAQ